MADDGRTVAVPVHPDASREKDRGFTPTVFAEMLGQFRRLRRDELDLDGVPYEQLDDASSFAVHAQLGGELREHVEVVVLGPDLEVVDKGGGCNDRVHRPGPPLLAASCGE